MRYYRWLVGQTVAASVSAVLAEGAGVAGLSERLSAPARRFLRDGGKALQDAAKIFIRHFDPPRDVDEDRALSGGQL